MSCPSERKRKELRDTVTAENFPHWLQKNWKSWKKWVAVHVSEKQVDNVERDLEKTEKRRMWGILSEEEKLL